MERRFFLRNTGLVLSASMIMQKKMIAELFNVSEFKIKMLRNNVGVFTERGGTIGFLLGEEGIVVIDAQFPEPANHLIEELKKLNQQPILYLINTHHHGDHTSGNISFKGIAEHIVAHENSLVNQQRVAEAQNTMDKTLLPDMTFPNDWKLKMKKEKIKADYFGPGHTNGDAVIHFEEANITHMGDLMFNRRHPFIDRTAGASIANWITILDKSVKRFNKDTIFIFGHSLVPGAETGSGEDLKLFKDYLEKLLAFATSEVKAGKSKEEFLKNTSIPGVTEWKGDGIERPLTAAYEEVSTKGF
jgi:cyclase